MSDLTKTAFIIVLLGAVLVLVGITSNGCSRSKTRQIDVSQGQYYSEDELLEMSDRNKSAYCQTLQGELATTQQEFDTKTRDLQETKVLT